MGAKSPAGSFRLGWQEKTGKVMKGKFGKIGIISLGLVLALGGLGTAFAFWSEPVTIASTVSTGELRLELTHIDCSDNEPPGPDVGDITREETSSTSDSTTYTLTITNAYPGYVGVVQFHVENTGTIPAHIYDVEFDDGIPYWAEIGYNQLINLESQTLNASDWRPGCIIVSIYEEDYAGNPCQENYSFDFTVTIHAKQWNAP